MPTTEHTINDSIAEILRETRYSWRDSDVVSSENTGMLRGNNRRPDILVVEPNVSPVAIETEIAPALTVEAEAATRLGEHLRKTGRQILSAIAVRLPVRLIHKSGGALRKELAKADDLEIAIYTGTAPDKSNRWPQSGWISGSITDLSIFTQSASVPPDVIEKAADELVTGVTDAAGLLGEMAKMHPGAIQSICEALKQENHEQTWRMAAAILANAFIFQESLAGGPGGLEQVLSIAQLRNAGGDFSKSLVIEEWRKILKVNYWPIFDVARRILEVIPAGSSKPLIERLASTSEKLVENRLMRSHDLTGAVFQKLIADRKFLAAYYTTPASAALLVGLAINPNTTPANGPWDDKKGLKELKIADFACGTGTLISTAYQKIGQLHEMAGGNAETLHPEMMASALVGCDVLPAAAHLTASMLAGAHPTVKYKQSSILTVAYGKQPIGHVALGSLDLLIDQGELDIIATTAKAAEGMGEKEMRTWRELPHAAFDFVVMNPPFTRPTGHEGEKIGVHNPMFAAFSATKKEQHLMGDRIKELTKGTSYHGNAGEASAFLVLAQRKLKLEGTLALVMPLSLMSGEAWEDSRKLLASQYSEIILVSIAGGDHNEMSFSADTGMGECLVVGCKKFQQKNRATFVVLKERPAYPMLGAVVARQIQQIRANGKINSIENGPIGGTPVFFGTEKVGQILEAPLSSSEVWNLARIADLTLAQTAYQLAKEKKCWLPTMKKAEAFDVPISTVAGIHAKIGPYHADINFDNADGTIRGPFDLHSVGQGSVPTYPVLWAHDAEREKTISFECDREGFPKTDADPNVQATISRKVATIWAKASNCHFNQNFQFNSQATGMQFTRNKTIGGRAWTSILLANVEQEKALVLWGNTTLGLLLHWWHANKQQSGRGNIVITALESLPVLDVTKLSKAQLKKTASIFQTFAKKQLLPFFEIDKDQTRRELDKVFLHEVLGFKKSILQDDGPLNLLRKKLAHEPSIRGGKDDQDEDEA
jgi:hypothetical protein